MNKEGFSQYCNECNIKNINYNPAERLRKEGELSGQLIELIDTLNIENNIETKTIEESQKYYGMSIKREDYFNDELNKNFKVYIINFVKNDYDEDMQREIKNKHATIGEGYGKNYISFAPEVEKNLDQLKELVEYLVNELRK